MIIEYNIYCDESCHLENDRQKAMVLGAIWCPITRIQYIFNKIREIKIKNSISEFCEIKWTKISQSKSNLYIELVDYFFSEPDLHFRALIIPDKSELRHKDFGQSHEIWYYKMYFNMLKAIFSPSEAYNIYIDIKDTKSGEKIKKLHEILCNNFYDFSREIIKKVQPIRSHEVEIIQLTDLFIGAVSYINRELSSSPAKNMVINRIKELSGYSLKASTLLKEEKFNLFVWHASNKDLK